MDIMKMTALETAGAIKDGSLTSVKACEAALAAVKAKDEKVNAFITLCEEEALAKAAEVDARLAAGDESLLASPLAGVPLAIKDNICTKGIKTSCASKILGDFKPFYDATVIEKLGAAGALVLGKTNMDEFAMGSTTETSYYGATRNPWDPTRVPGGSSGGSGAAVAAGQAAAALGSDTGGSIRQPAAYCGVTGFKPTYGTVSRYGLIAYASSLDQIGPLAKDVADCAAIMDVICGKDPKDGTSLDVAHPSYLKELQRADLMESMKGMRIGIPRECLSKGLDEDVKSCLLDMGETLTSAGAQVEEMSLSFLDYVIPAYYIIAAAEASSNLSRFDGVKYGFRAQDYDGLVDLYSKTRSEGFGSEVKKRILLGTFVLSSGYYDAYYRKALQVKAIIKKAFDEIFANYDAILMPAAPTTAPALGDSLKDPLKMYLSDIFTVSVNIAGLPGLTVPTGFDRNHMPVGTQIIGPALGDSKVLKIGHAYQQMTTYHKESGEVK